MKVSFAADGIILTQDLYVSKILERFGFTSAAKSATTPLAHGTTLTRADEEDAEARHLAQQFVGAILYAAVIARPHCHRPHGTYGSYQGGYLHPSTSGVTWRSARRSNYHLHGFNRAEALVDHPTSHRRTKHIEIRREFIKFHIGHETVKIERVSTKDQLADIMTKPLRQDIHNYLVQMIRTVKRPP
ncbi:RNA-dependent DNA polymerase [Pseudoscourfieldia marina]